MIVSGDFFLRLQRLGTTHEIFIAFLVFPVKRCSLFLQREWLLHDVVNYIFWKAAKRWL